MSSQETIPRPQEYTEQDGTVRLNDSLLIEDEGGTAASTAASTLRDVLSRVWLTEYTANDKSDGFRIVIKQSGPSNEYPDEEGYKLRIEQAEAILTASTEAGLYYGIQTIIGLVAKRDGEWCLPCCTITDWPRSQWRGVMIDPARGDLSVDQVKQTIDRMARAKLNRLHLHLTDNEGWILELESVPGLAGGVESSDSRMTYSPNDVREIVNYAEERQVEVIPEIDLPGHCAVVLNRFPELRCESSDPSDKTVCIGTEETYDFAETVLAEVAELFPSDIIHVGGDEWPFEVSWEECDVCQDRMDEIGKTEAREYFYYFLRRIHEILDDLDKRMMVWNDQIDVSVSPDLPRDTIVHFWIIANEEWEEDVQSPVEGCSMDRFLEEGFNVVNSYAPATYISGVTEPELLLAWNPERLPAVSSEHTTHLLGGEMPVWRGEYYDDSGEWRSYFRRALPSAIPVFADRVWNGEPIAEQAQLSQTLARHVLGPAVADELNVYDEFGSVILPTDPIERKSTYPSGDPVGVYESLNLSERSVSEAIERYEAAIGCLQQHQDAGTIRDREAAAAYVEYFEWLAATTEEEQKGSLNRP